MERWQGAGGCAEVLQVAFPLILSTGAHTLQMFIDRVFLMWYSSDQMSAAMPAGIMSFTFASFFLGTVSYANTFVAQYTGADRPKRVGPAVWQSIFFALGAGVVMLNLVPLANSIFNWAGHDPTIRIYEIIYFKILVLGATPMLLSSAISSFFTGRKRTWTVLWVNLVGTAVNIVLDYCLIFGNFGFPRWGIAGAALATVSASVVNAGIFATLFFRRENRRRYASVQGARLDRQLFGRLMRYGLPNGTQFMLEMLAFSLFITFVGRLDKVALGATSMAFQVNMLAFMPMIGLGIALSTLVGQALGKNNPRLARRSTWSACYVAFGYMTLIALGFWFLPGVMLYPYAIHADQQEYSILAPTAKVLLRFVAFYSLFDAGNIIFAAALKGAGDTRFVMLMSVSMHWLLMVIPTYVAGRLGIGLYIMWTIFTAFVCVLAAAFLLRFLQGKWQKMRVIEMAPAIPLHAIPEVPTLEIDAG